MTLSLKCQYAIRGVLELTRRHGRGAVPVAEIAKVYDVSARFLEVILNELKRGGFVGARRGPQGGFFLSVDPASLTIGDIVRFVDGPPIPVKCVVGRQARPCPQLANCRLQGLWDQARQAVEQVYDSTTFADIVRQERPAFIPDYSV